jgi:uncharacterized phage infection (PIP) family protein YhgE
MSLLNTYRKKLETQIHEHKGQIDALKARARRVAAQGKILGYKELAKADKQLDHVTARLKELKGAGGGALGEIRTGVKKALVDLQASTKKAAQHFQAHASKPKAAPARPRTRTKSARPAKTRK